MRFLAVDDEPMALKDIVDALREAVPGCEVAAFSKVSETLEYVRYAAVDAAFLDIELGHSTGLVLAKDLKDIQPDIHIIFVTSFQQYAYEAIQLHATGYLMKPALTADILQELTFLYGSRAVQKRIQVQTFGGFQVFVDGIPLVFSRAKSKELLAYLVKRHGNAVTTPQACALLWEDNPYNRKQKNYYQVVLLDLRMTLSRAGIEDIIVHSRNSLAVDITRFDCDSYQFLDGDPRAVNSYHHDYLCDYSWAEDMTGLFEKN